MLCVKKYKIVDNKKKRFKSVSLLKKVQQAQNGWSKLLIHIYLSFPFQEHHELQLTYDSVASLRQEPPPALHVSPVCYNALEPSD